ncbi:iron-siderophore ABC transporter substrate-binding protein [Pelagibacterium xiamenense]|uniref:iron-siderophore ABC transporter substrate-binding protein n=1 Tax=Pelagibacterium xiamenense TaxID=2901140 RepID=UPI001E43C4C3|nr:iron-siderophore ABC transporter substrate-binding protein [Pelagibacterium xiamenense]MCD7058674.1 iron-siderophore ABC transporter substrate-binding protein [Pelagibacterium xiamenense]
MIPFARIVVLCLAVLVAGRAVAQDFPLTIAHKFGTTTIEAQPERVASLDYNGADNLLALGVQPVTVKYWFGDYPRAVWPWADALLEGSPEILRGELNFEQIAATDPDVIIALYSGITDRDYEKLSAIAPVVAVPEGVGDYELAWDQQALIAGRAIGMEAEAEEQVQAIKDELAAIAGRHPDWAGQTITLGTVWEDAPYVYTVSDPRVQLLNQLGFANHPEVEALSSPGEFSVEISAERPEVFDADVLIWFADEGVEPIRSAIFRPTLTAVQEGREVFLGPLVTSALSHTSLLSLPYAFEVLEPSIELAIDGDPATEVPVSQ